MDEKEFIIPAADDAPPPAPASSASDDDTPAVPAEVGGELQDNDTPDATGADNAKPETSGDATPSPAGEAAGGEGVAGDATPVPQPDPARPAEDKPVAATKPKLDDPGTEFTPKGDYAFDIELADGTKVHIAKPEDIEQLPVDADFGSPANLMKAQASLNVMASGIEAERREWESAKEQYDKQQETAAQTEERINTMIAEMNYLETKGKLPKVAAEYEDADWTDPKVQEQPGVKERLALLNYRAEENKSRATLNLPPMSLLEAHTQMQLEAQEAHKAEVKDKQAEQRKAKGAMVGGANPTPPNAIPNDMIVGEGGSIRDLNPAY